jgi:hypothetical protein
LFLNIQDIRGIQMKTQQSGSVLAISLVLLTAITLIAIMGMQRAGLQTKITGAIQHKEENFNMNLNDIDIIYQNAQYRDNQAFSDALNSINNKAITQSGVDWGSPFQIVTTITHIQPPLEAGKIATSSIRDNNSRGKNGAGIEKFVISSEATHKSGIKSIQAIGTRYLMPE